MEWLPCENAVNYMVVRATEADLQEETSNRCGLPHIKNILVVNDTSKIEF